MIKEQTKILKIEIILIVILAICTLSSLTINKFITAGLLLVAAIVVSLLLKRNKILKANKQKILIIMVVFGILYVALYYMIGLYTGYYNQVNRFGLKTIVNYIIPITIIIVSTEIIRSKLLLNDSTKSKVYVTIIGTLADISIYLDVYGFSNLNSFLALIGFVTFAAIANNMMYTYVCNRYGNKPVVAYKLITYLYLYIIPIAPTLYIFFRTFVRMIYPLIIYSYLDKYYNLDKEKDKPKETKSQLVTIITGSIFMIIIIALVSCKFAYGVLVIGSESMTGSIDKGDVVFFQSQDKGIKVGDVIVFKRDDIKVVHRVVKIKNTNNETKYYTKGDANAQIDTLYVTKETLMGKVLFKIKYIGQPTLWLRNIFDKEG